MDNYKPDTILVRPGAPGRFRLVEVLDGRVWLEELNKHDKRIKWFSVDPSEFESQYRPVQRKTITQAQFTAAQRLLQRYGMDAESAELDKRFDVTGDEV
jgi:hypothetical protein